MTSREPQKPSIETFAARLWQHARFRALGADKNALALSVKQVCTALDGIDPIKQSEEIGETLAAHIMKFSVHQFSRKNCITCREFAGCEDSNSGLCFRYSKDEAAYRSGRALLAEAVLNLDGAYGIDAQQLLTIVCRFLDGMENDVAGEKELSN